MTSIALGLFVIAIIYVAVWSIKNDGLRSIRDQSGFIRMRVPRQAAVRKAKRQSAASRRADAAESPPDEDQAEPPAGPMPAALKQRPRRPS